jgi:hypothetical protein
MTSVIYKFPESAKGANFTFDAESNGLLEIKREYSKAKGLIEAPAATRIWMICHKNDVTGECFDFIDDEMLKLHKRALARHNRAYGRKQVTLYPMSALPQFWKFAGRQTGHYAMKFDFPLVEKLLGYHQPRHKRWDTLVQSSTQFCDREYVFGSTSGVHSVESWALRIGKGVKVEHEDWMNFSIDMYKRCWRDVEVQCDILVALEDERETDRLECNISWDKALKLEHDAAFWIAFSEKCGYPLDLEHANKTTKGWDVELEGIEDKLLPKMPFRKGAVRCGTKVNWEKYSEAFLKNTDYTRIPIGWCWAEDSGNKPTPIWKPFKKDGSLSESVKTYWSGRDAQDAIPAEPERFAVPAIYNDKGKVEVKAIRARKARPAIEAKEAVPDAYHDDAGLTDPPLIRMDENDVAGAFTRIQWDNYNLGSNDQVIEFLTGYTEWQPTEYTDKGNSKLTEDSFDSIDSIIDPDLGKTLKYYLITRSRRTNVTNFKDPTKGWTNNVRPDGRVTPRNNTMGTPTARSRHSVIVNVPSVNALHGAEMRKCWVSAEGCKQLGIDAAAIEARAMAHEIDCDVTKDIIVNGDFHTLVWDTIPDFSSSRSNTKTTEYALLYGSGDQNLGSTADVEGVLEQFASKTKLGLRGWIQVDGKWRHKKWSPKKESLLLKEAQETVCGAIIRSRIMKGLAPLGAAIDKFVKLSEKGYLVALDGRKLQCRSSHSAFNLRLQSTGAIICKTAMVLAMDKLEEQGLVVVDKPHDFKKHVELYTFYHDELQFGVPESMHTPDKIFNVDFSDFDLNNPDKKIKKAEKKLAEKLVDKTIARFLAREKRTKGRTWSVPVVDYKLGTIVLSHSIVADIATEAFYEAGRVYGFTSPVESAWNSGYNWYDCH